MMDDDLKYERRYGPDDRYLTVWEELAWIAVIVGPLAAVVIGLWALIRYGGAQ